MNIFYSCIVLLYIAITAFECSTGLFYKGSDCPDTKLSEISLCISKKDECSSDLECPEKLKCCQKPCGKTCVEPKGEFKMLSGRKKNNKMKSMKKSGNCPSSTALLFYNRMKNCKNECFDDFDCTGISKCCKNGCNYICQMPVEFNSGFNLLSARNFYGTKPQMRDSAKLLRSRYKNKNRKYKYNSDLLRQLKTNTRNNYFYDDNYDNYDYDLNNYYNYGDWQQQEQQQPQNVEDLLNKINQLKENGKDVCALNKIQEEVESNKNQQQQEKIEEQINQEVFDINKEIPTKEKTANLNLIRKNLLNEKKSSITNKVLNVNSIPQPIKFTAQFPIKFGECPAQFTFGSCKFECYDDTNCEGEKICCHSGCGYSCTEPLEAKRKPGECPNYRNRIFKCDQIEKNCLRDRDCPANEKCCATGCLFTCMKV